MTRELVHSVCIFGSMARSSADTVSDKDILVIAEDYQHRLELSCEWKERGWSVSAYTPNRFEAIVRSGSLFVQHIKHEGMILVDSDDWLRKRLQSASPKISYQQDARNSGFLAQPIDRFIGDLSISERLIVADMAFVCVRNFGINHLADRGELIFDYSTIISEVGKNYCLNSSELDILWALRLGKSSYRKSESNTSLPGTISELKSILGKFFPYHDFGEYSGTSSVRCLPSGYARLRDFEATVVSELGRTPNELDLGKFNLKEAWKWVTCPQNYTWEVRCFDPAVQCTTEVKIMNLISPKSHFHIHDMNAKVCRHSS